MKHYLQRLRLWARRSVHKLTRSIPALPVRLVSSPWFGGCGYLVGRFCAVGLTLGILAGCSTFTGKTIQADGTETRVSVSTFWDSKSELSKAAAKVTAGLRSFFNEAMKPEP